MQILFECARCGHEVRRYHNLRTCPNCKSHALLRVWHDTEMVNKLTAVVREADELFEKVGGSSRHWVRDCFVQILEKEGLRVVRQ